MIIKVINNTDLGDGFDSQSGVKGQNNHMRLMVPNEGKTEHGDTIHFFSEGLKKMGDKFWINPNNIFLINGQLQKKGVLVYKDTIKKTGQYLNFGDEQYFRVVDSNMCEQVVDHDIVIVSERTGHRFNYNQREYFFIQPNQIFLVFHGATIRPGPDYLMLEKDIKEDSILLGLEEEKKDSGTWGNKRYFFSEVEYEIDYDTKKYLIVRKTAVKLEELIV